MPRWIHLTLVILFVADAHAADDAQALVRGEYVLNAAGCVTCHTDEDNNGKRLAGGLAIESDFGTFYTPNITPDKATGIGAWSEADFARALREGRSPKGHHYYPAFPYTSYTRMRDDDVQALWAYLRAQSAVAQQNKKHQLKWFVRRPFLAAWKALYFEPGAYRDNAQQTAQWNRGAYIAQALTHCGECHTPRNRLGAMEAKRYLVGTPNGPDGDSVPNITPDKKTGIGSWSSGDLMSYFDSGMTPDGDFAGSLMADVIDHSLKPLTAEDKKALIAYLRSVPALPGEAHVHEHESGSGKKKDEFDF